MDEPKAKPTPLWRRIEVLRIMRGYSMRELARRAGLSHGTISMDEKGYHNPTDRTLAKLAKALDVPVEAITQNTCRQRLSRRDWDGYYQAAAAARESHDGQ